ncbi:MAG: hypothetical protein F4Z93_06475, partial [Rhodospirillales bacterium]|nr:hypothetical protein [Rhodospirillales bacterium]
MQVRAEGHGLESAWSGEGALNPAITILPSSSTVTEGRFAQFTLYPFPTWSTDLTVNLTVADAGGTSDFVASGDEGAKTFTIHAGNPFADYQVRTVSDATDEPDGDVTVTVEPGTGYVVGSPSSASVTVNDDDMVVNPAITLVSTIGQPASTGQGNLDSADLAQEFTTGSNSTGYTLESIALDFRDTPRGVSVKLATGLSRTSAGTVVATLTNPALSSGTLTFTAPSNTTLSASTTYYVVVEGTSGVWLRTDSNAEDAGAAAGWSVADGFLWRQRTSSAGWSTGSSTYRIRVDGTANAAASPTITIAAGTSPVTEGTAAEFTVTASEAPSENLTVNLSVADAGGTSDFVAAANEGSKTVTIAANTTSIAHSVPTVGDSTDEPDGDVTVTVASGTGYTVGTASSASVTVNDDDAAANTAPVFTNQPTTANVDENSADGTAVQTGSPAAALVVTATDADAGDTRTYSLDAASDKVFDIDASTGAVTVQVESGSALDFEAAPSVTATVTATDSHGATATHDVAIGVNDRDEPPDAPAAPTVAGASPTSVTVGWTAPDNTGKPAISDYDVRFKLASASAWTPHVFTGAGTGTTIPGLTENTSYDVQVMAKNDEGSSAWSAAGSGSTNANNPPVFTGQPAAATVTENSADGTAVVAVTATEPDAGDSVRYSLDAASDNLFAIDSSTGAITVQVESGSALDFEAAPSITATVTATDTSNATATHRVAIAVADEDEPPDAPGEPAVAGASSTSVDVGWTAPANAGKPPVSDYDVQFRVSGATNWTAHGFTGTGTGTTISGLSPGTTYQVQVMAKNAEGSSAWSAASSGATDANSPPVF